MPAFRQPIPRSLLRPAFGLLVLLVAGDLFAQQPGHPGAPPAPRPAPSKPAPPNTPAPTPAVPAYTEPVLQPSAFNLEALGMIEAERKQHAQNLAAFALTVVLPHADAEGKLANVPAEKFTLARKMVGLALHLDPRNKTGIVVNGRLKSGVVSKNAAEPTMGAAAFSTLLVGRSEELVKAGGADNLRLAGYFLDLAVALDKDSDAAVYARELFKMDGHAADWKPILGGE